MLKKEQWGLGLPECQESIMWRLWTGISSSPYVPFINIAPVIAGTNGIAPIFLTTVGVTGGIGIDLKNWVTKKDENGKTVVDKDGEPVLEQVYSIENRNGTYHQY